MSEPVRRFALLKPQCQSQSSSAAARCQINWQQRQVRLQQSQITRLSSDVGNLLRLGGLLGQIGVIAEEVGEVVPELVSYEERIMPEML